MRSESFTGTSSRRTCFSRATVELKVLDFGVARLIEGAVTATRPGGGIVGTPAFMAPEQVLGKTVDPQSDLYSVGATAFALLSKRYVHDAENAAEMMVVAGSRPAQSLGPRLVRSSRLRSRP